MILDTFPFLWQYGIIKEMGALWQTYKTRELKCLNIGRLSKARKLRIISLKCEEYLVFGGIIVLTGPWKSQQPFISKKEPAYVSYGFGKIFHKQNDFTRNGEQQIQ